MNGRKGKALFDSNVFIYLSKKELPLNIINKFDELFISVITYMEILGFNFINQIEEKYIRELLSVFKIIYIDNKIAEKTIEIRKKKRIKLPDAIIAGTAIVKKLYIVTRNIDDFKKIDVNLLNPFKE